nr:MAG TPA: hypothetical protein [Caudoviricetes sp.]
MLKSREYFVNTPIHLLCLDYSTMPQSCQA